MTILGRILSGAYGVDVAKHPAKDSFFGFAWMEMGVFFLEDGAAVLVLAKSTGSPNIIEHISTYLTVTCGLVYILYYVKLVIKELWGFIDEWALGTLDFDCCGVVGYLFFAVLPLGSAIFFMYILATEVIFAQDDDPPLSGELEVAAFVVYGIHAFFVGGFPMLLFIGDSLVDFMGGVAMLIFILGILLD